MSDSTKKNTLVLSNKKDFMDVDVLIKVQVSCSSQVDMEVEIEKNKHPYITMGQMHQRRASERKSRNLIGDEMR